MILSPDEIRHVLSKHPELKSIRLAEAAEKSPSVVCNLRKRKEWRPAYGTMKALSNGLLKLLTKADIKRALADMENTSHAG